MSETPQTDYLADIDTLADKLGRSRDDPLVIDALTRASGRFRDAVGHHVSLVVEDGLRLDGTGRRNLRLPLAYVQDVHAVTCDGEPVEVEWSRDGILRRRDGRVWPDRYGAVEVVVTHGLDPVPDGIQAVVLDQAEAIYTVKRGLSSYQVGGVSQSFAAVESVGVTEQWSQAVERWQIGAGDRA